MKTPFRMPLKSVLSVVGAVLGSVGSALTGVVASICCIGPAGLALLGVNGAILGAAIKPFRVYLLGASLALLAYAHWRMRRTRSADASCSIAFGRRAKAVVWIATGAWIVAVLIQIAADNYWI